MILNKRGKPTFIEERHQEILRIVRESGRISIGEIQSKFHISVDSARRDLRLLEEKKLLKRTHGGAIPIPQAGLSMPRKWHMSQMKTIDDHYDAIALNFFEFLKT